MIVLVDTDVLLDVALERSDHVKASAELLDALQNEPGTGLVVWHTLANFYYMTRESLGDSKARAFLKDLLAFLRVAPTRTEDALRAANLAFSDFEDALQAAAAMAGGADVIATRNLRDYKASPVPALSPQAVLKKLKS